MKRTYLEKVYILSIKGESHNLSMLRLISTLFQRLLYLYCMTLLRFGTTNFYSWLEKEIFGKERKLYAKTLFNFFTYSAYFLADI